MPLRESWLSNGEHQLIGCLDLYNAILPVSFSIPSVLEPASLKVEIVHVEQNTAQSLTDDRPLPSDPYAQHQHSLPRWCRRDHYETRQRSCRSSLLSTERDKSSTSQV
jgi:hypothetical protein